MKRIVVLTGAGISAESGIKTFRDDDGLWRTHRFEDLATPEAWERNMQLVLDFYNERRKQLFEVEPNEGHHALVKLESYFHVDIITQNVDDLHERAGSKNVLHLHGELKKVRSTKNPGLVYTLDHWELKKGNKCAEGAQLRPHIVWFGEAVPNISKAIPITRKADIMIVVGTSLQVYPAAGLLDYAPSSIPVYLVDPKATASSYLTNVVYIKKTAATGLPELVGELIKAHSQ
ncbi:MAG: NAD-dependent deacylase [Bacteroidales bacterium]|nr:NAD-dependent deacylase [Bacteroidales bacterium]